MYKSGNTSLVRNLNKHHILNLVRLNQIVTARKISDETGLQMSTTLNTLKSLEKENYIINKGLGNTTLLGGKPPVVWGINPDYGKIIGVELTSKEMRIVVINFIGGKLYSENVPLEYIQSHIILVHQVVKQIKRIIEINNIKHKQVLGIGIGFPGSIDYNNGIVTYSKPFDYHSIRLKALIEKQLPYKVLIDNDANAGAIGVNWLQSKFNDRKNILFVCINLEYSGMGIGLIINGQVYRGSHSAAGEVETLLDSRLLSKIIRIAVNKHPKEPFIKKLQKEFPHTGLTSIIAEAKKGGKGAVFILKEIGKEVSKILTSLISVIDPELVVIGGDICYAEPIIKDIIKERIKYGTLAEYIREIPIHFSEYKEYSGAMGAAALVYSHLFSSV